jgi:hypothetical protein
MRNHRWCPTGRGVTWAAKFLAVSLVLAGAGSLFAGTITIDTAKIPPSPGTMKRLKNSRANAPTSFVQEVLATSHPNSKLEGLAQSNFAKKHGITAAKNVQAAIDNDHVVASIDPASGHADVMPDLTNLAPMAKGNDPKSPPPIPQAAADQAQTAAQNLLRRGLFPSDATHASLGKGLTLNASQYTAGTAGAPPAFVADKSGPIMTSFPVHRLVGNVPVVGQGSRGVIHVGANGKVHGFSRHWQNASDNDTVTDGRTPGEIADLIKQQLAPLAAKGDVVVQDVSLAYYDGDKGFIQPVYQFHAKVTFTPMPGGTKQTDDDYVAGYIPFGTDKPALESIPSLTDKPGNNPNVPQGAPTNLPLSQLMPIEPPAQTAALMQKEAPPGDPSVGRYVVRNDDWGWVDSANRFYNGLQDSGYGGWFSFPQYYWAYQYEFQGSKNYYINSVNVAEVEAHGDWWIWTTYQNWGDVVTVDSIPYPGLGSSAGGVAAYFIIHSCEVVPSAADTGAFLDHWWHVFGGLHTVFGYRTIMYIHDGIMYPFGVHMGWGWNLVSAWLNDVVSSSMYYCWFGFCPGDTMHGTWKPYGRPSTISVCGHENDSVYYTAGVGPAGCLWNYWYN